SGLTANLRVIDGPLQPGTYRFTAKTGLTDRANNPLTSPFTRTFSVIAVAPFVIENRNNNSPTTATPLGTVGTTGAASVTLAATLSAGSVPVHIVSADLNGDTNLDLVVCNISSDNISVYLGNGDGTFAAPVYYATGDGPICAAVGDVNADNI